MVGFRYSVVAALVGIFFGLEARAQLSELELVPNPASTLEPIEAVIGFPWFAASQTFEIETEVTGSVVTIEIAVAGQPSGAPFVLIYLEDFGPLAPGEYEVVANYRVDDVLLDSEVASLLVLPVRAVPVLESPFLLGILALLLLAAVSVRVKRVARD